MGDDDSRDAILGNIGEFDRPPFATSHKIEREHNKFHLLIALTGSVAVIKLKELIDQLHSACGDNLFIKIVATKSAITLVKTQDFDIDEVIYEDRDEWSMWKGRGDQVLHIELRKWADLLLIAPLDANSMAKMALGLSDNLVTSLEIPPMEKTLMCGDSGVGAMASVELIVSIVASDVKNHFSVYTR